MDYLAFIMHLLVSSMTDHIKMTCNPLFDRVKLQRVSAEMLQNKGLFDMRGAFGK